MRSSVSYMLSHGAGETQMSEPDYQQEVHHHGALLVLIRGIGANKPRSLQNIFERIQRVQHVHISDAGRDIWVRFVRDHPVENNDWGDFQTHRRLLGLITVGSFANQLELNELCRVHESLKVKYVHTLYDSRSILFGPNHVAADEVTDTAIEDMAPTFRMDSFSHAGSDVISCSGQSHASSSDISNNTNASTSSSTSSDATHAWMQQQHGNEANGEATKKTTNGNNAAGGGGGGSPMTSKKLEAIFTPPSNFKSTAYFYPENDLCPDLEAHIKEFIQSLFWILESKRLERTREKVDKVSLLLAPFEKKDFVGLDMESRNNKKRCFGRITKHLADLSLQVGLVAESLNLFHAASETLRAISDSLWLGAACEGLCAASAILLYPQMRQLQQYDDDASHTNNNTIINNTNNNDGVDRRRRNSSSKNNGESSLTMKSSSSLSTSPSISSTSSVASSLSSNSTSSSHTLPQQAQGLAADLTGTNAAVTDLPANTLKPEQITSHYREAIINYSKYRHAGIIETEAALKAARICIVQKNNLDVAMFLQSVLYINLTMSEQVRVQRFETLTELYQSIGYNRKAAFCQRLAAWRHVGQSNQNPDWAQSYRLMLDSFGGHRLSLDPIDVLTNNSGWPCLQVDLLQQLAMAAKRLGHSALATRHMTFLLQTMWQHLSANEQREMCNQLQSVSAQCEGSPVALNLENGTVIPPANLTDLPLCTMFQVKELMSHLRPIRIEAVKVDQGPFLFTPIHFNSMDRKRDHKEAKQKGVVAFDWVQFDCCEVTIKVINPLPFDVQLGDVRLLASGVAFESYPQTVTLAPKMPTYVTLHGSAIECGQLLVEGYSTHTLGVKSECRLRHMFGRGFPPTFQINVVPGMPKLKLQTSLPQTATFIGGGTASSLLSNVENVVTTASMTMYNGERIDCVITVTNCSNIPIEYLHGSVHVMGTTASQGAASGGSQMFKWDNDEVQMQLPILPHETKQFVLQVYAEADFLGPVQLPLQPPLSQMASDGPSSIPTHLISQTGSSSTAGGGGSRFSSPGNTIRRNDPRTTSSFRSSSTMATSTNSGHSSLVTMSLNIPQVNAPRQVDAQLRLRYSGGAGLVAGYCRQCTVALSVHLMPSAQITSWDVLPAEVASEFYLVLDVINLTAQEMSLQYTDAKNILVEAHETCRVPVPVARCPLEKIRSEWQKVVEDQMVADGEHRDMVSIYSGGAASHTDVDWTEKVCSKHIAESVDLTWTLLGTENTGTASLKGITLSPVLLDLVTVAPLQWAVFADHVPVRPQGEINCMTGQCLTLGVSICNTSAEALHHLTLSIRFYQDYQNGVRNYLMETRISTSGPNEYHIPVLETNEKASHEVSVIFFNTGRFKADIQCRSLPMLPTTATTSRDKLQQQGHATASTMVMVNNRQVIGSGASSSETATAHTWRFIPSVEITVVE